nr:hypothetical protein [Tanacetum cinerariifolium]
ASLTFFGSIVLTVKAYMHMSSSDRSCFLVKTGREGFSNHLFQRAILSPLEFVRAKKTMFPVISRMGMDILSVQATSVASKSAFSTNFEKELLDAEVQENEAIPLSDEEIALGAASSEGFMFGPGSRGEEVVDYGYDVYHDDY